MQAGTALTSEERPGSKHTSHLCDLLAQVVVDSVELLLRVQRAQYGS